VITIKQKPQLLQQPNTTDLFNLRFGRPKVPNFTEADQKFEIGKALKLNDGTDITIIATGHPVWQAIEAAELLEEKGISVDS